MNIGTNTVIALIDERHSAMKMSMYEAAETVVKEAQAIMDEEKTNRINELRRISEEGRSADKELAALGAVGRPRKARRKRSKEVANGN